MSRPLRIQYPGAVYHVTCRGNERKEIFVDDADRKQFIELLRQSAEIFSIKVYCYVLMSNHFHLLIETPLGNLGEFMRRFNISYTGYYNRRHKRVGHLYQGRYKSILIDKDSHLSMVSRYIHLNPIRTTDWGACHQKEKEQYLKSYKWSSLPGYIDPRCQEGFVDYAAVLSIYDRNAKTAARQYLEEILRDNHNPLDIKGDIVAQSILGREEFVREIRGRLKAGGMEDRECPPLRLLAAYKTEYEILKAIEAVTGKKVKEIKEDRGHIRYITMEMLSRFGGMKGKEIGDLLGVDYSTVSVGRKRLRERLAKDKDLCRLVEKINETCQL